MIFATSSLRNLTLALLTLCMACVFGSVHAEQITVIHAGKLMPVPGEAILAEQTLIVATGEIVELRPGYVAARELGADATLIDLSEQTVMPGFIDMHVHLLIEAGPERRERMLTESRELNMMRGARNARITLEAGFTTVRDLGGDPASIFALRDAVAQNLIPGPRILAAGAPLAATGGHGDVDGIRHELMTLWTGENTCDGVEDCRRTVRRAIKYGSDWIKVTASGGVMSDTATGLEVQMTDDELAEIVRTAHALGIKVAMHAHGTSGISAALQAGADTIDHGSFQTRETIRLHKSTGAYFVPTLMPGFMLLPRLNSPMFSDAMRAKAKAAGTAINASFDMALRQGVKIAFGTDTGVTPHAMNAKEFELMVNAGMSPDAAIRSATVVASEALGLENTIGTLEVGKRADMVGVIGDPLRDIRLLQNPASVIKDGRLVNVL